MIRRILATLFLALLVASPALAQTGQINGVITDNTGGVVPGATVKAVEAATGLSRDTVTGADGRYIFTSLRPTTYDITAELDRVPAVAAERRAAAGEPEPHGEFRDRARHASRKRSRCRANRPPSTSPRRPSVKSSTRNASSNCR